MKSRVPLMNERVEELLPAVDWDHDKPCDINAGAAIKFYAPDQSKLWYAAEWDDYHEVFLGLVVSKKRAKLDYFALSELEDYRDSQGECVKRDTSFRWASMRELKRIFDFAIGRKRK